MDSMGSGQGNPGQYAPLTDENEIFEALEILNDIASIIDVEQDFEYSLSTILDKVLLLTGMKTGGIYIKDDQTGDLQLIVSSDDFLQIHKSILWVWKSQFNATDKEKLLMVSNLTPILKDDPYDWSIIEKGLRSYIGIPLTTGDSFEGILMACSSEASEFSRTQQRLFSTIGRSLGTTIKNHNAMEKIIKSRDSYIHLFENARDAIFSFDLKGNFLRVNRAGADILGCDKAELLRSNIRDFLTEEGLETACAIKNQIIQGINILPQPVLEVVRKDGKKWFLEYNISPIIEDKKPAVIHCIARDVDKRLRAEKNILVFSKAIEMASDGINISDCDHKITYINEAGARLFGYSKRELIGQPANIFYAEEDLPNLEENVIPAMEKYGYWNGLILGRKKDGTAVPVGVTLSSVNDEKGSPIVNIGVFREIKTHKS